MSHTNSFAINNIRQYVEYVDGKNNQLAQIVMALNNEVMKLKKIVTKLKNGEEIEDEEENTTTTTATGPPQMAPPQMAPQMAQRFAQMPQLQTLNLNSSHSIDN